MSSDPLCDPTAEEDLHEAGNSPGVRAVRMMQRFGLLWKTHRYEELRAELARAELGEDISELYILSFQAILAMGEGSELARDYLEMAEAVASSPLERAVVAESWAVYDLLQLDDGDTSRLVGLLFSEAGLRLLCGRPRSRDVTGQESR